MKLAIQNKTGLTVAILCACLLVSCESGGGLGLPAGNTLVGRWESYSNAEHTAGVVYEFADTENVIVYNFQNETQRLYPGHSQQYRYSAGSGVLNLFTGSRYGEEGGGGGWYATSEPGTAPAWTAPDLAGNYLMVFVSDDELTLTPEGGATGMTLVRVPSPEIPLAARIQAGKRLIRDDLRVTRVEKFSGNWQDAYPGYAVVAEKHYNPVSDPQQWALFAEAQDGSSPRLILLIEGEEWWGVLVLAKGE